MSYYFGQMFLYRPFLHYLTDMANGSALPRRQSQYALSCIKVASNTISRAEVMLKQGAIRPHNWTSVYTVFISVVCLMFLVAAHPGTAQPGEAWRRAEMGMRILAVLRCVDDGANACLKSLKVSERRQSSASAPEGPLQSGSKCFLGACRPTFPHCTI